MTTRSLLLLLAILAAVSAAVLWLGPGRGSAEAKRTYVGSETCSGCHQEVSEQFRKSPHYKTVLNPNLGPAQKGCEACHGPGSEHAGGDTKAIIRPQQLSPEKLSATCLSCHTQSKLTHWKNSTHAQQKLTCVACHDAHDPTYDKLLSGIDAKRHSLEGLNRAIKDTQLAVSAAGQGTPQQAAAEAKLNDLKKQKASLEAEMKGYEGRYRKVSEPNVCYNCHARQKAEANLPSHHPFEEGKMKCSGCHNPHGGAAVSTEAQASMLNAENTQETCFKCHADKAGPFLHEHPPVTEDCMICHRPHGSVNNNLLRQSHPMLCLRCHAQPHTRSGLFARDPGEIARYDTGCTRCHFAIHGSDRNARFTY